MAKKMRKVSQVRRDAEDRARKRGVSEKQIEKSRKAAGIVPPGMEKMPGTLRDRKEIERKLDGETPSEQAKKAFTQAKRRARSK